MPTEYWRCESERYLYHEKGNEMACCAWCYAELEEDEDFTCAECDARMAEEAADEAAADAAADVYWVGPSDNPDEQELRWLEGR